VRKDDIKPLYSNSGSWIDICAPGGDFGEDYGILSTIPGNEYDYMRGTSMASPLVAAVCGLVKSHHPNWDYDQIVRQVVSIADNIDAKNPGLENKLGYGRVNVHRALTVTDLPELNARLAILSYQFSDSLHGNNNGVFERNEE
jgi:subtilisin family serine protease